MRSFLIAAVAALSLTAVGCDHPEGSVAQLQSPYPSNYPVYSDARSDGPVTVNRSLQSDGGVGLNIYYTGDLQDNAGLGVYVKANYLDGARDGLFPLDYATSSEARFSLSSGCLRGALGGCAESGTDAMKHLLYWATYDYNLNALDLEVSFVDGAGNWDSRYGANYRVSFPPAGRW